MNERNEISLAVKWLRMLIYICITSMLSSLVNVFPFVPPALTTWINRGIMAAMAFVTYKLAQWNLRYKKAATFRALMLAFTLITAYLLPSTALTFTASICSIIAVYQEYSAHAELIEPMDQKLSGKWRSLFLWSLIAGVLVSFGAIAVTLLMIVAMQEGDTMKIAETVLVVLSIPQLVVNLIYIGYLRKMMVSLLAGGEVNSDWL